MLTMSIYNFPFALRQLVRIGMIYHDNNKRDLTYFVSVQRWNAEIL